MTHRTSNTYACARCARACLAIRTALQGGADASIQNKTSIALQKVHPRKLLMSD